MTALWAFWHILALNHRIKVTRPHRGVVINRCTCGQNRAYTEPVYFSDRMRGDRA